MAKKITKSSKPVKKAAKTASKSSSVKKKVVKPAAKKVNKPAAKKIAKPKPKAKKPVPVKKQVKPAAKKTSKPVAKKVAKAAPKKTVLIKKATKPVIKVSKSVAKVVKHEPKKVANPVTKATQVKTATPPSKPVVKVNLAKKIIVEKGEKVMSNTNTPFNDKPLEKEKPVFTSIVPKKTVIEDIGKTRYSDIELEEFRKLINEKLASAKKELENLKEALNNISDNSAADTESSYATFEDGSATQEKEHLSQMAARQRKFIGNLDAALVRIENKTYGICAVTGKLIPKERLRAVPHTTVSIEAKLGKV